MKYQDVPSKDLATIVLALRQLETDNVRPTLREVRYILSGLTPSKFVEVVHEMELQKVAASPSYGVLSGATPSAEVGR